MSAARSRDVEVPGGTVRVVEWGPVETAEPPILAIHGITANHRTWEPLVRRLPERRIIATDLRGRGRSADLTGPWGMERHALDLLTVLDDAGVDQAAVVGHSMGASVAHVLRHLQPERVASLLLVDGGLPLPRPYGITPQQAVQILLGPALDRLSMTFPSPLAYREFWQRHPAFANDWSAAVERYVQYDLVEREDGFRSSVLRTAVEADFIDQMNGKVFNAAVASLEDVPFGFLRSPLGLQAQPPGLYAPEVVTGLRRRYPHMHYREVEGVNHYTILLADRGAAAVELALVEGATAHG